MFSNTMTQWLSSVRDGITRTALLSLMTPLFDRKTSVPLSSAGLAIKAAAGTLVKAATASHFMANGILQKVAANTDMPALSGTVTNATFNCWAFFIDSAGAVTSVFGTAGSTRAAMKLPQFPQGKAFIGFVIINPTGTGDFIGGTTALDDATVVPTAEYVNGINGFDPYCLTGL